MNSGIVCRTATPTKIISKDMSELSSKITSSEKNSKTFSMEICLSSKNMKKKRKKWAENAENMQFSSPKHSWKKVFFIFILEGGIFCLCRKPYEGETDMCEC